MKKAQGLSLNTIIIAAIVLIVLVVLWAIFTGRMGVFSKGLTTTQTCEDACNALNQKVASGTCGVGDDNYIGMYADNQGKEATCCCSA